MKIIKQVNRQVLKHRQQNVEKSAEGDADVDVVINNIVKIIYSHHMYN